MSDSGRSPRSVKPAGASSPERAPVNPATPAAPDDAFQLRHRSYAESGFYRRERLGFLDVSAQIKSGTCLNAAEMLEAVAVELALDDLDQQSCQAFAAIRKLALAAVRTSEKGSDDDPLFAKYRAMRLAATAVWMLGGDRQNYFDKMLRFLHESIRAGTENTKALNEPKGASRLALHYAQAGRWFDILNLPRLQPGAESSSSLWRSLFEALTLLARSRTMPKDAPAAARAQKTLDAWFIAHTSFRQFERAWDPELTSNDILSVAEIRAFAIYGERDPWRIARSIRNADLVVPGGRGR
ncbi:MAG: hypothetical protein ABIT01_10300 [Thermoanaerobaculia bacterium]